MKEEMKFVEENDTWELVDLSCRKRPIDLKWVFKLKRNKFGSIVKYKACFVAKGYVQRSGIDYDDAFAHVAQLKSVCAHASWTQRLARAPHARHVHVLEWGAPRGGVCIVAARIRRSRGGKQGTLTSQGAL
jgi:hypothetical protein